jgi:hypothetical protein
VELKKDMRVTLFLALEHSYKKKNYQEKTAGPLPAQGTRGIGLWIFVGLPARFL